MTSPADLVAEACDLLATYLPRLERLAPEPDEAAFAVPGMTGRPAAAPLPGNAQAIYALTGIQASARQLEGVLLYAAGKRRAGPLAARGGSDANTLKALDAITRLAAAADDDLWRLVMSELEQRLNEARCVPAIDEAQQWRFIPPRRDEYGRPVPGCPYCHGYFLKAALDSRGRLSGRVECRSDPGCRDYGGQHPAAQLGTDEHGRPVLAWPDFTETAPDLEELCPGLAIPSRSPSPGWTAGRRPTRATRSATMTAC